MNGKLKKTKNIIILSILILIIIIIVCCIFIKKNNLKEENNIDQIEEKEIKLTEELDVKNVYNIERCINKYFNGVEDSNKIIKNPKINNEDEFYIKNVYIAEVNSKNTIYFVNGTFINNLIDIKSDEIEKKEVKLIIVVDNENETFDISLYGNKYTDIINYKDNIIKTTFDQQKIKEINENIEYQSFNFFYFDNITEEQLAKRFYEDFKINALYFPEDLYKMLDEEYKKERFGTIKSYEEYIQKFKTIIEENTLSKYSIDTTDKYTEYTLVDTRQNTYIVRTKESPMEYTIFLDNYTIKTEGYEKRYSSTNDENKISTNIKIFMSMINTADYSHAYNLLDDTFKENNFKTKELFEQYINNNFFEYNTVNIKNIKKQGSYYICEIELKNNNSSASEKKELTIIMKLLEGIDFVMSFNIK